MSIIAITKCHSFSTKGISISISVSLLVELLEDILKCLLNYRTNKTLNEAIYFKSSSQEC